MQSNLKLVLTLTLLASIATLAIYNFNSPIENSSNLSEINDNLDCGFTADFSSWLKSNGIYLLFIDV
jgi:hypothetical protein